MFLDMLFDHQIGPNKTLQDLQACFKPGGNPLGSPTEHLERHADLTTLKPQNIATPNPMLRGNKRHASRILYLHICQALLHSGVWEQQSTSEHTHVSGHELHFGFGVNQIVGWKILSSGNGGTAEGLGQLQYSTKKLISRFILPIPSVPVVVIGS